VFVRGFPHARGRKKEHAACSHWWGGWCSPPPCPNGAGTLSFETAGEGRVPAHRRLIRTGRKGPESGREEQKENDEALMSNHFLSLLAKGKTWFEFSSGDSPQLVSWEIVVEKPPPHAMGGEEGRMGGGRSLRDFSALP
jgi:hypothetical protein